MKFALVDGEKRRPTKGQRGTCEYCGEEMVAKCGPYVRWHWAHMPGSECDPWWGPESEWHRGWKDLFPDDWQEIIHVDGLTGERHIADVRTPYGLVIEFQSSPISHGELTSRESFYQNMIWMVNGEGRNLNHNYFNMGLLGKPLSFRPLVHRIEWCSSSRLFHKWSKATVPVYFDFGPLGIWHLLEFFPDNRVGLFAYIDRDWLIDACKVGTEIPLTDIPFDAEEEYLELRQMVEVRADDYEIQGTYTEEW